MAWGHVEKISSSSPASPFCIGVSPFLHVPSAFRQSAPESCARVMPAAWPGGGSITVAAMVRRLRHRGRVASTPRPVRAAPRSGPVLAPFRPRYRGPHGGHSEQVMPYRLRAIRAHPLLNPAAFGERWRERFGSYPAEPEHEPHLIGAVDWLVRA